MMNIESKSKWQLRFATLGIFVLPQVKEAAGVAGVLALMAVVSALGAIVTAWLAADIGELAEGRGLEIPEPEHKVNQH